MWGCGAGRALSHQGARGPGPTVSFPLPGLVVIACDNKAALSLHKDPKEGQRSIHIGSVHPFAMDCVVSGELAFVHCKSDENVSDCLTKALAQPLFERGLVSEGM